MQLIQQIESLQMKVDTIPQLQSQIEMLEGMMKVSSSKTISNSRREI